MCGRRLLRMDESLYCNHCSMGEGEQDYLWEWRHPADTVGQGVVAAMKNVWTSFAKDG